MIVGTDCAILMKGYWRYSTGKLGANPAVQKGIAAGVARITADQTVDTMVHTAPGIVSDAREGKKVVGAVRGGSKTSLSDLPENVQNSFNGYEKAGWQGNPITYREFDVNNYNGINRDGERFIVGSDDSVWYTDSHYGEGTSLNGIADFIKIK